MPSVGGNASSSSQGGGQGGGASSSSNVSDFVFLGELGRGSYGVVYKVRRKVDKCVYVMKQINIAGLSVRERKDAINEVKILASLEHENIVRYFDSFIENDRLHVVMEYCEHGDLNSMLKNQHGRKLREDIIWKLFLQMCLGLGYIHSKRILHRDIKSLNIFLDDNDNVKIGDFGVAKILSATKNFHAQTMVGTPYYLSPELCENKPYNEKSDVWALGVVLYELLTLKHPFDANNQGALILKIIRGKYPAASTMYSNEIRRVLDTCLSRSVTERPKISELLSLKVIHRKAVDLAMTIPETLLPRSKPDPSKSSASASSSVSASSSAGVVRPRRSVVEVKESPATRVEPYQKKPNNILPSRVPLSGLALKPRVRSKPGLRPRLLRIECVQNPSVAVVNRPNHPAEPLRRIDSRSKVDLPRDLIVGGLACPPKAPVVAEVLAPVPLQPASSSSMKKRPTVRDLARRREKCKPKEVSEVENLPDIIPAQESVNEKPESDSVEMPALESLSPEEVEFVRIPVQNSPGIPRQDFESHNSRSPLMPVIISHPPSISSPSDPIDLRSTIHSRQLCLQRSVIRFSLNASTENSKSTADEEDVDSSSVGIVRGQTSVEWRIVDSSSKESHVILEGDSQVDIAELESTLRKSLEIDDSAEVLTFMVEVEDENSSGQDLSSDEQMCDENHSFGDKNGDDAEELEEDVCFDLDDDMGDSHEHEGDTDEEFHVIRDDSPLLEDDVADDSSDQDDESEGIPGQHPGDECDVEESAESPFPVLSASEIRDRQEHQDRRNLNRLLDRQESLEDAVQDSRSQCMDLVGRERFEEIYAYLRSKSEETQRREQDENYAEKEALEMWDLAQAEEQKQAEEIYEYVFSRIPLDQAELITKIYQLLYLEDELSRVRSAVLQYIP